VTDIAEFLAWAKQMPSLQDLDYEMRKLTGIKEWAIRTLTDLEVGDTAVIHGLTIDRDSGWWIYREALADGARCTVIDIDYNLPHAYWGAHVRLEREWAVGDEDKRWWHGTADTTPEGFTPPSTYDQKRSPGGTRGMFFLPLTKLSKVGTLTS